MVKLAELRATVTTVEIQNAGRQAMLTQILQFLYKFYQGPFFTVLLFVLIFVLFMFTVKCLWENQKSKLALEAKRVAAEFAHKRDILALLGTVVETRDPKSFQMMVNLVEPQSHSQAQAERPNLALSWPSGASQLNSSAAPNSTATDNTPAVQ